MSIIFSLIIILFSAVMHEYMHGWMADRLGDSTARDAGRLTLNPINHIDLWGSILMPALIFISTQGGLVFGYAKPVPFNPYNLKDQKYGVAKVAIAGPLANFFVALFLGLLLRFLPGLDSNLVMFIATIIQINLVLFVFNLLPIPPLDGSKVIMPFLPYVWQEKLLNMEQYGMYIVLIFVLFGFPLIVPIINLLFNLIIGI
ncbi:site-2 protease family protein [Patescibacteria group bacterium]|nr:site-2 protease family protein [Patescibacteria group bacterium]MBU0879225.1 site-2 protease family protein [Patescibacteria group bacterium]MBU0880310.1 site-2 protease family protein [Patescibacteria group bacterium]MBU1062678.1 site-2 protease family protein [Patescibacteria group bacterium]MBU1783004.1 site-2 protease family protein [Patescibacteria group bacterium]